MACHASLYLAPKRLNLQSFAHIYTKLKAFRMCYSSGGDDFSSDEKKDAKRVPIPGTFDGGKEPPFIFADERLGMSRELVERPFIFSASRKKKRKKKKQRSTKAREYVANLSCNLMQIENDSASVVQAIEIFNSIPSGERKSTNQASIRRKEISTSSLINELRKSKPHILGLEGEELKSRYNYLCSLGIERINALQIAISFPSFLTLQNSNVGSLVKLFSSYKIDLAKVFFNFPYAFGLPYNEVVKKLDHLGSIGLKKKDVSALVNNNPNVICFEINESGKAALKFATGCSGWTNLTSKSSFIEGLIRTATQEQCSKYEFNDNFTSVAEFLTELQIPMNDIFRKDPTFFSYDKEKLLEVVHYLGGSPFFFDGVAVGEFIQKYPDVFLQFGRKEVKDQINHVWKELDEEADLYEILQTSPRMLTESYCLLDRIDLFKHWSFKTGHIIYLMKKFPILFIENRVVENLEDRLQFLLGSGDISVQDIMKFPFCLQLRIVLIRCKVGFIRRKDPDIFKSTGLKEIFTSKLENFAVDICSASLTEFHEFMKSNFSPSDQEWILRKGKPREIEALKESF